MRGITVFTLVFVAVGILITTGCQGKNEKMREFLKRYGNETAGMMYEKSGYIVPNHKFADFNCEIESLKITSEKTKDSDAAGVTYHFVKGKMIYKCKDKGGNAKYNHEFVRYMALTIEEDGFGNLLVNSSRSKEYYAAGINQEMMEGLFGESVREGEQLIR